MTEAEWLACGEPGSMLGFILPRASDRKLRYFGCTCCRLVFPHMEQEGSRALIWLAESYADGHTPADELETVRRNHERHCHDSKPDWEYVNAADDAALMAAYPTASVLIEGVAERAAKAAVDTRSVPSRMESAKRTSEAIERLSYPVEPGEIDQLISTTESLDEQQHAVESSFRAEEQRHQTSYLRDIFGNPFRPVPFSPSWRTSTAVALASQMYESRDFSAMPILADALQDAGCDSAEVLDHCRGNGPHVRGCWVVDLVLDRR